MLVKPMKRICPSLKRVARSNTLRQALGLRKGSKPSNTSISAKAPRINSDMRAPCQRLGAGAGAAAGPPVPPDPRIALKKSDDESSTIMSLRLRNAVR